jgi:hypothetical protein
MDVVPDGKEGALVKIGIYNLDDSIDPGTRILISLPCVVRWVIGSRHRIERHDEGVGGGIEKLISIISDTMAHF